MNKMKFYEAIYSSCDFIVARRKSVVLPLLIILAGVALPLVMMAILKDGQNEDINSAMVLLGIALAVTGGVMLLGRLSGSGEPYHKQKGCYLTTTTPSFDRTHRSQVLNAIGSGDINLLMTIPTCDVSALCVMVSQVPDGSFAAAQAYEYAELEYKELCAVTIMKK